MVRETVLAPPGDRPQHELGKTVDGMLISIERARVKSCRRARARTPAGAGPCSTEAAPSCRGSPLKSRPGRRAVIRLRTLGIEVFHDTACAETLRCLVQTSAHHVRHYSTRGVSEACFCAPLTKHPSSANHHRRCPRMQYEAYCEFPTRHPWKSWKVIVESPARTAAARR